MKKLNDLTQERTTLIGTLNDIVKRSEDAGSRTEADETLFNDSNDRVTAIDTEIKELKRMDELNKSIVKIDKTPEIEKVAKRYDLSKAIAEARSGGLTGLELEMNQEARNELGKVSGVVGNILIPAALIKRANEETKTTGLAAGHIPTQTAGLDLVVSNPLYKELGATVYENLSAGKLDIPFSQGHTAAEVAEAGTASQSVPTDTKGTLTASRFQGWQKFTNEYLAESSLMSAVVADMIESIDRGVGSAVVNAAVVANIMTGFAADDVTAALTWNGILDMIANLNSDNFKSEGFVASKQLFYELAALPRVASTDSRFVLDFLTGNNRGKIAGINTAGTGFLPVHDTDNYDLIYGDWSKAYVGFWSGVQLLVDPYSASDDGYTKITFSRMGDVVVNPYAFTSKRNAAIS